MSISAAFGDMSERMKDLATRGKAMLKPPPIIFGSPRQVGADPLLSWWHIPVFIQPTTLQQKQLENCIVTLAPYTGQGSPLRMRWRTRDSSVAMTAVTLEEGRLYLVPVAARKENGQRAGIITNESFFVDKKAKWIMRPGKTKWTLQVKNDAGNWESEHSYVLNIPPPDQGNGRFSLEVDYEGLK